MAGKRKWSILIYLMLSALWDGSLSFKVFCRFVHVNQSCSSAMLTKQSQKSRSILLDGSRFLDRFERENPHPHRMNSYFSHIPISSWPSLQRSTGCISKVSLCKNIQQKFSRMLCLVCQYNSAKACLFHDNTEKWYLWRLASGHSLVKDNVFGTVTGVTLTCTVRLGLKEF